MLCRLFARVMAREMRRGFHNVRLAHPGVPALTRTEGGGPPLIIYTNHPSWWDPAFFIVLATRFFDGREHYGPIEAAMLDKYRFMRRIGIFGIEPGTLGGAAEFLRIGEAILAEPRRMLWVTAQGRFSDPRSRPLALRPGVTRLMRRVPGTLALPLAVEYPFWTEKRPEALARFGAPEGDPERLEGALTETANRLAEDAMARDPSRFEIVLRGGAGIGGIYDAWRGVAASLRGRRFSPEHLPEDKPKPPPGNPPED